MHPIGISVSIGTVCLWLTAFVFVAMDPGPLLLSAFGRWVLMSDGQPILKPAGSNACPFR